MHQHACLSLDALGMKEAHTSILIVQMNCSTCPMSHACDAKTFAQLPPCTRFDLNLKRQMQAFRAQLPTERASLARCRQDKPIIRKLRGCLGSPMLEDIGRDEQFGLSSSAPEPRCNPPTKLRGTHAPLSYAGGLLPKRNTEEMAAQDPVLASLNNSICLPPCFKFCNMRSIV